MSKSVTLQVPMSRELKVSAERKAKKYGFSSLQEFVRFILYEFDKGHIRPAIIVSDDFIIDPKRQKE